MCAHRAVLGDFEWGVERESSRNGGSNGLADRIVLIGGGVVGRRRRSFRKGEAISDVKGLGIMREGPRSELDGAQS